MLCILLFQDRLSSLNSVCLIGPSHKSPPHRELEKLSSFYKKTVVLGGWGIPSHEIMAVLEFKKRIKHDPTWFLLHGTMIPSTSMGIFLEETFGKEGEIGCKTWVMTREEDEKEAQLIPEEEERGRLRKMCNLRL
ncbi:hypothetical protein Bca52824_084550 [Brassica carinata]|uniref:Uncharacterized protein n=1 Tax=Brassica carinata TaxID=52824 RepID=A0A8X7TUN4_BRACI|nr:hypothetical protein Bca52824_084550 [Brassica carinata]